MTTTKTFRGVTPEPHRIDGADECGNHHPWRPERFRVRMDRPGHGSAGWERDCLVCKEMANKARCKTRNRNQQLVVHVTAAGDHYNTRGGE